MSALRNGPTRVSGPVLGKVSGSIPGAVNCGVQTWTCDRNSVPVGFRNCVLHVPTNTRHQKRKMTGFQSCLLTFGERGNVNVPKQLVFLDLPLSKFRESFGSTRMILILPSFVRPSAVLLIDVKTYFYQIRSFWFSYAIFPCGFECAIAIWLLHNPCTGKRLVEPLWAACLAFMEERLLFPRT